ncbi:class I SAM-dependent methyltransferase [Ferribacterium limneticum]|uniref:class I SAM-dependent methyltransferase n=1 Tax=Ferribacterium limneticum TaxID=76259 RepID=UPI001CF97E48|nr:methyltransferase domain-containing protein [Ferribacterium limneticum]UCV28955.1 class I SAM-dependent methyltransferase [Ferribacterium limneticum]UCV32873.1 class I SAM-dependent methyltransferase [Ferribacterium limneticum]
MTAPEEYFEYLKGRSRLGWLYRRYWLYPRLCRYLDGKTLDIGCGIGDFLNHRTGTVGVDINPATVEWCLRRGLDAHQMSPNVLPFQDVSFDSAILDNVLEHLIEPAELLKEIRRVLRPHSSLVVGVPGHRGYATDSDHKVFYDEATLVSTLAAAGFGLQRLFHMPLRSAWLNVRIRQYCLYGVFERD